MSATDPISVLDALDGPATPRAELADALLARCIAELEAPRVRLLRRPRQRALRVALVVAAFLVLAGAATATYFAVRGSSAPPPKRAQLTIIESTGAGIHSRATIAAVGPGGRLRTLWRCPDRYWCGDLTSISWSPDGKRLAFTVDEIGGSSGYVGLHIVDLATGADLQLPSLPIPHISRPQPASFFRTFRQQAKRQLGCVWPSNVAWSSDGERLFYDCGGLFSIRADGSGRRRIALPAGVGRASWLTVSPDGKEVAFASGPSPRYEVRHKVLHSSVYVVALGGSRPRLVAKDASVPSWSPDGRTIAYDSACGGIRLSTPGGVDVTPGPSTDACRTIGVKGRPVWSPDGSALAIGTREGVYVVGSDGTGLYRATIDAGAGLFGVALPAWTPGAGRGRRLEQRPQGGL